RDGVATVGGAVLTGGGYGGLLAVGGKQSGGGLTVEDDWRWWRATGCGYGQRMSSLESKTFNFIFEAYSSTLIQSSPVRPPKLNTAKPRPSPLPPKYQGSPPPPRAPPRAPQRHFLWTQENRPVLAAIVEEVLVEGRVRLPADVLGISLSAYVGLVGWFYHYSHLHLNIYKHITTS
ncbi:hypothetical protein M8C21_006689, partial [Ambrosia artemisiifolia]